MPDSSPTVRRRRLAYELRRLREAAGMTIEEVATALECSDSKISRIETAQVGATPRDVRDMVALYGIDEDDRELLIRIAREARQKGWWHDHHGAPALVGFESSAAEIYIYTALLVPGLLQTEQYIRAVLADVDPKFDVGKLESTIKLRMERQERLRGSAKQLTAVMDEAVLHRLVGGRIVMRQQLEYLLDAADQSNLTLVVLPFAVAKHAGVDGYFSIYDFPDPNDPDIVHLEGRFNDAYISHVENPVAIRYYKDTFKRLRGAALDAKASKALFASRAKELQ